MKIVHITAGTGNFYCGTCLRDDVLVRGLRKQGHDAMTVPLYLPIVRESRELQESPLFFGGINVFLQQKLAFFRNSPRWLDRVFDSRALLRVASRMTSLTKPHDLGELTLSTLKADNGFQVKELKRLITLVKKARITGCSLPLKCLVTWVRCSNPSSPKCSNRLFASGGGLLS